MGVTWTRPPLGCHGLANRQPKPLPQGGRVAVCCRRLYASAIDDTTLTPINSPCGFILVVVVVISRLAVFFSSTSYVWILFTFLLALIRLQINNDCLSDWSTGVMSRAKQQTVAFHFPFFLSRGHNTNHDELKESLVIPKGV